MGTSLVVTKTAAQPQRTPLAPSVPTAIAVLLVVLATAIPLDLDNPYGIVGLDLIAMLVNAI
jgi:hypothetical protein